MKKNWYNGIMGAIVGDALGVPFEFKKRGTFKCEGMEEYGTHHMPKGTWSDDSSMILATMDSIANKKEIVPQDINDNFIKWLDFAEYTATGKVFDCGATVLTALQTGEPQYGEHDNGNGSLMRILPVCLYCAEKRGLPVHDRMYVHAVAGLTHGHARSKLACDIYYCLVYSIIYFDGKLTDRIQKGIDMAFELCKRKEDELRHFDRIKNTSLFKDFSENQIRSGGYVVDSLEASLWCLLNSSSYEECVKKAVNLGDDTDTTACIAGGLAGLYYGAESIPEEWLSVLMRREWIESMIEVM